MRAVVARITVVVLVVIELIRVRDRRTVVQFVPHTVAVGVLLRGIGGRVWRCVGQRAVRERTSPRRREHDNGAAPTHGQSVSRDWIGFETGPSTSGIGPRNCDAVKFHVFLSVHEPLFGTMARTIQQRYPRTTFSGFAWGT